MTRGGADPDPLVAVRGARALHATLVAAAPPPLVPARDRAAAAATLLDDTVVVVMTRAEAAGYARLRGDDEGRVAASDAWIRSVAGGWARRWHADGAAWALWALALLAGAAVRLAARLVATPELDATATNTLAHVGHAASREVRRALLRGVLDGTGWNLAHAAATLRLGSTPHALRAIRDLGLGAEYEAARTAGRVARGRPPLPR